MGQSCTESRIHEDLIWELAPLVMLIVALFSIFRGLEERRKSRECARARGFAVAELGEASGFQSGMYMVNR